MMNYFKQTLLATSLTLVFQASANAALVDLGVLSPLHLENFTLNFTNFASDTYSFTTTTSFAFTSSVTAGGDDVSSLYTALVGSNPFSLTLGVNTSPLSGTFNSSIVESFLNPGDYTFDVIVNGFGDNAYFGNFTIANTSVSAVPEPQTYAMFLAGLGLLGFAKRRKG